MTIASEQDLIKTRLEQLLMLLEVYREYKTKFDEASNHQNSQIELLDDELEKLRNSGAYENSAGAEAILEYLKYLTDRHFNDIHMWTNSFKSDTDWLNENLSKCDSFHTYMWCKMMEHSKAYGFYLNIMHSRFQKLSSMVAYIKELLSL